MSKNILPQCPDSCNIDLPEMTFDECMSAVHTGEIETLYFAAVNSECLSDVTSLTEWNSRISNTAMNINAIRRLRVIADMPAAASNPIDISHGKKYYPPMEFTINAEVEDNSDENYYFMQLQACGNSLKVWAETAGGDLFGGVCGLSDEGVSIHAVPQIERGNASIHKQIWTLTWKSKFPPDRNTSPMA